MSETAYKTKQRDCVAAFLKENAARSFTVDELYDQLRQTGAGIGKTTVYRCVDTLVAAGEVRKYDTSRGKSAAYQFVGAHADCQQHFHLKCTECGKLVHLSCEYMKQIDDHILSHHNFHVDNTKTVLYGVCDGCRKATVR